MLKAKPAILNEPDNQGFTALFLAADKGNEEALGALIEAGADINKGDEIGYTPLMAAAYYGHVPVVERLLTHQVRGALRATALRDGRLNGGRCAGGLEKGEQAAEDRARLRRGAPAAGGRGRAARLGAALAERAVRCAHRDECVQAGGRRRQGRRVRPTPRPAGILSRLPLSFLLARGSRGAEAHFFFRGRAGSWKD